MIVSRYYTESGIVFQLMKEGQSLYFPMKDLTDSITNDEDWNTVNILEQIWYQGFLERSDDKYLLTPEDFYELDTETIRELPITHYRADIGIREVGNTGNRNYAINWYVLVRGKDAGRCVRKGCIVSAGGYDFLLNREQYKLISEIEKNRNLSSIEERARYQARTKFLAEKAKAKISEFTAKREFVFSDDADLSINKKDDHEIELVPQLSDISEEIADKLPKQLHDIEPVSIDHKRIRVFTSDEAREKYNNISRIPAIKGTDVPRFLENPKAFIPEEIEFDEEMFSKRVKGLKVRTSSAVPYIHIEPREGESGWFDIDVGFAVHENSGDEEDYRLEDDEQLQQKMEEAAKNGEDYIYHNNSWIKIDPSAYGQYKEALKQQEELGIQESASQENLKKLLDIYENIEGIEYNECVLEQLRQPEQEYSVARAFHGNLKDYQKEGYGFLRSHYSSKMGVLLADDMGLGKTVQVIALLAYMFEADALSPALLVMPNSLIDNWKSELSKFLPSAKQIYVHQGSSRCRTPEIIEKSDVVLTTYETLARDQVVMATIKWSCIICDEVQKIKNFRTYAASAVKGMNAGCKIALTGTPVENRLSELWSITDFVQPGLLDSYQKFRNYYEKPIQADDLGSEARANELISALAPVFLRRTKEDVLKDSLPDKSEQHFDLGLNEIQDTLYRKLVEEVKNSENNIALGTIQKLIMLCSHPRLVSKRKVRSSAAQLEQESPKLRWTVSILRDIQKKGEKAVIFTGYKVMQAILRQVIYEEFGIDARIINGEVKDNRLDIIKDFSNREGFNVLILSPRAAGVGLNIVAANHVIHYTREWNPAIENQATDRCYRIGQIRPVKVYYPVMKSPDFISAEERLDELLTSKRKLMRNVIVPSDLGIKIQEFKDII